MHKQFKSYNANFHIDGLLDADVRDLPSFQKTTKACAEEFFLNPQR